MRVKVLYEGTCGISVSFEFISTYERGSVDKHLQNLWATTEDGDELPFTVLEASYYALMMHQLSG